MHLRHAGYTFEVLGGAFVLHFPHQRSDAKHHWLHSSAHAKVDRLFVTFTRELMKRYADTPPATPLCDRRSRNAAGGPSANGASLGNASSHASRGAKGSDKGGDSNHDRLLRGVEAAERATSGHEAAAAGRANATRRGGGHGASTRHRPPRTRPR